MLYPLVPLSGEARMCIATSECYHSVATSTQTVATDQSSLAKQVVLSLSHCIPREIKICLSAQKSGSHGRSWVASSNAGRAMRQSVALREFTSFILHLWKHGSPEISTHQAGEHHHFQWQHSICCCPSIYAYNVDNTTTGVMSNLLGQ